MAVVLEGEGCLQKALQQSEEVRLAVVLEGGLKDEGRQRDGDEDWQRDGDG